MNYGLKFPAGFSWGSATSAYQVEGGIENNDWAYFSKQGRLPDAGLACDHYNRYEEDFDLAKQLGQNAHRFSIEWSRVEPEQGKFDEKEIDHYRRIILTLKTRGLEPFVTLHHFTNPVWFSKKGGWENPESSDYFARYAERIFQEFKDKVKFWITINEPALLAAKGYFSGNWPPFKKNPLDGIAAILNLIRAHKKTYKILKRHSNQEHRIGIAYNYDYFEPYNNQIFNRILTFLADYFKNKYFLNRIRDCQDFIGLNYYHHNRVKIDWSGPRHWLRNNENKNVSDMGWEIYPQGIYYVLRALKKYGKPIYVTENGLADAKDEKRAKFILEHLKWVHKAIQEGIDVHGYFHWSLIDNFEWDKGFWPRFGLVEMDYKTLERKIRPSAQVYKEICQHNAISD